MLIATTDYRVPLWSVFTTISTYIVILQWKDALLFLPGNLLSPIITKSFPIRTLGDGMEKLPSNVVEVLHITPSSNILKSMKPVEPASKVINLVPKFVPQDKKVSSLMGSKPKEPRFVPYEPYKAAVQPMKVLKTKRKRITGTTVEGKPSKNNVEIQELLL
ncbi:hypothetical protein D910_08894 [Dendroctonus ponderosae]|uniref:Uncharacterized protein n=1 Tax=Dendroctonus ponderosae TaxID=77166 RepID=U4UC99_DENPD|nr:hypothetical protein D910_08894 [Dendroctonus ponderosae]